MNFWLLSCVVSAVFALIIAFVLGAFWLADRADDLADYERQLAEGDVPWPLRHDELAARPDWVAEAATREGRSAGSGGIIRQHKNISSRLLSGGSEGSL